MALKITAPEKVGQLLNNAGIASIFLAGSIENGKAEDWQDRLTTTLDRFQNLVILNPRRKNWDPDLDGKKLADQIRWEQDAIKQADIVAFYFDPNTKSPISLLELGQCLGYRKTVVVFCPPMFYRYTNVEVTCAGYGVQVYVDYHQFVAAIIGQISHTQLA